MARRSHCNFHILSYPYSSSTYALQRFLCTFLKVIHQNIDNSTKFSQVCPAQPLFPYYGNRAVDRQPSFRTEDSQSASSSLNLLSFSSSKFETSIHFEIFFKFIHFFEIFENLEPQRRSAGIIISTFEHIYIDLQHTLDKVFCALFSR